jgi:hypothetical protein
VFFFIFPLFFSLTCTFLLQPSQSYLFLFFIPLLHACTCNTQPAEQVSFFSFIPGHVINHLTTMCFPHGFVVTDRGCFQPIVTFVGFHVCPLLETKHGPCAVCFLYIVCSPPLRILQPKVSEFSSGTSLPLCLLFPSPTPMPPMPLSSLICSLYLIQSFPQWFLEMAVYGPKHRRALQHLWTLWQ